MLHTFKRRKREPIALAIFLGSALTVYFWLFHYEQEVLSSSSPYHHFHVVNSDTLTQPHAHIYKNTISVMPVNSGMLTLAKNAMCSLARIDPTIVTRLTIWAMNEEVVKELEEWNRKNEAIYNNTKYKSNSEDPMNIPVHGFGVFYDPSYTGAKKEQKGWEGEYLKMMLMRRSLFANILEDVNLLFMDADLSFFADPYKDMGISDDFPGYSDNSADPRYLIPDFIYATDPKDHYFWLTDPYEFQHFVPKICGCLFFARANNRTINVMRILANSTWNDQEGIDKIFNFPESRCTHLIYPLPPGVPRKTQDRKDCNEDEAMRVQLLDLAKYTNGQLFIKHPDHYKIVLEELEKNGGQKVFLHPNIWDYNFDKAKAFADNGAWFLDDDGMCKR